MTVQKIFTSMLMMVTICVMVIVGRVQYQNLPKPSPLSYRNLPFPPSKKRLVAGEVVPLLVDRCNSSDEVISYRVSHRIESTTTRLSYVLPGPIEQEASLEPGCTPMESLINTTSKDLSEDWYKIIGTASLTYREHTYIVVWYSEKFYVTAFKEKTK
jgi:hypothetical protein